MSVLAGITEALRTSDQTERAQRLSSALSGLVPHRALAMLVDGCDRAPLGTAGDRDVATRITVSDLARLGAAIGTAPHWQGDAELAGDLRPVVVVAAPEPSSVLVLVREGTNSVPAERLTTLAEAWSLFAVATQQTFDRATAIDLSASRAAAGERLRVTTELTDHHRVALTGILGALRARHLDDRAARQTAVDLAATALVDLRSATTHQRALNDEPLTKAFERLREELRPVARYAAARIEFAGPSGRSADAPVPAAVAHAARAVARGAVLQVLEQGDAGRIRVAWALGDGLEVSVRDDGPGTDGSPLGDDALAESARALGGTFRAERVPGWGTTVVARIPLDDATGVDTTASDPLAALRPREVEVLTGLADGLRNREIAEKLTISENTVKFHVANVLAKLGVGSRNHAALVAREAGLGPSRSLRAV